MFDRASLMNNRINGTNKVTNTGGLLIARVVNKQTGVEQNGTFCKDAFNWHSAKIICRSTGYIFGDWGSHPMNMENISKYVLHTSNQTSL